MDRATDSVVVAAFGEPGVLYRCDVRAGHVQICRHGRSIVLSRVTNMTLAVPVTG